MKDAIITASAITFTFIILGGTSWWDYHRQRLDAQVCQPFVVVQAIKYDGQRLVVCDSPTGLVIKQSKP